MPVNKWDSAFNRADLGHITAGKTSQPTRSLRRELGRLEGHVFQVRGLRTVHERVVLSPLGLAFERKQVPRFVGNTSIARLLEAISRALQAGENLPRFATSPDP